MRPRRCQHQPYFGWLDVGLGIHGHYALEGIEKEMAELARFRIAVTELSG
jgi:hypothetical protein